MGNNKMRTIILIVTLALIYATASPIDNVVPEDTLIDTQDTQDTHDDHLSPTDLQDSIEYLRQHADPDLIGPVLNELQTKDRMDVDEEFLGTIAKHATNVLCLTTPKPALCNKIVTKGISEFKYECGT